MPVNPDRDLSREERSYERGTDEHGYETRAKDAFAVPTHEQPFASDTTAHTISPLLTRIASAIPGVIGSRGLPILCVVNAALSA